ncbi:tetratricopeptide repeat protein [Kitasatospora sp. NPDC058190]|uniref:tetratricopeptide repeat protein n=1 Tax=Kitasatospora sp. NPDC058190 TaxID=3346371 RepID=UPI0036DEAF1A
MSRPGPSRHAGCPAKPRGRSPRRRAVPGSTHTVRGQPRPSERLLGPEHPDTLAARNNLAAAYWEVGDLPQALPLLGRELCPVTWTP